MTLRINSHLQKPSLPATAFPIPELQRNQAPITYMEDLPPLALSVLKPRPVCRILAPPTTLFIAICRRQRVRAIYVGLLLNPSNLIKPTERIASTSRPTLVKYHVAHMRNPFQQHIPLRLRLLVMPHVPWMDLSLLPPPLH